MAVGFADPSYFSRVFRREVGVSPSAYARGERDRP
jgi:AraC-like DNA-binding protein